MKSLKLICLLVAVAFLGSTAFSQTNVIGLKWNKQATSSVDLVNLNPTNGDVEGLIKNIKLDPSFAYVNNTLHHDKQNDLLYFQVQFANNNNGQMFSQTQKLLVYRASTGELLKSTELRNSMAPFIISEKNELGFIGTEKEHNPYGNNDDDISLVVFNMNTGKTKVKVDLPNLSFSPVNAPFVGEVTSTNGTKTKKEVSLSSTCFIPKSNEIIFAATDVMGIKRLFRVNINSGILVSSNSIDVEVLDMAVDANGSVQALFIRTDINGSSTLKVGTLNLSTNTITNEALLRTMSSNEFPVTDGSINIDDNKIFVSKLNMGGKQDMFVMEVGTQDNISYTTHNNNSEQYDFTFPHIYNESGRAVTLKDLIAIYPNPALSEITISSLDKAKATYVSIRNDIGQVVKEVKIENGLNQNTIDVSSLASGIYMVEVQTDLSVPITTKLVVQ